MKTIYLDEKIWGPHVLRRYRGGRMCCLGQALHQLGAASEDLEGKALPSSLMRCLPGAAGDFAEHVKVRASAELIEMACGICPNDVLTNDDLEHVLANINDTYFKWRKSLREKRLARVLIALRKGFAEAGYRLVFKPARP